MERWSVVLQAWHEFYTLMGATAATLMGLMFVVMSLGSQRRLGSEEGSRVVRGFFTPIVVFFVTVIVLATLMLIPEPLPTVLAALLAAVALGGLVYMIASGAHEIWRTSELGLDDLVWYVVLPYLSYAALGIAAIGIWRSAPFGLYTAAAATVLLLLIGIRNAWDLVVYTVQRGDRERAVGARDGSEPGGAADQE